MEMRLTRPVNDPVFPQEGNQPVIKPVLQVINAAVAKIKYFVRHSAHETKIKTKMQIEDCTATRKNS